MAKTFLKPLNVPKEIAITCKGNLLSFKGKLGEVTLDIHPDVKILEEKDYLAFSPSNDLPTTQAITGTMRALASNFIYGVSVGFEKKLQINGVGYRAKLTGNKIELSLGFSKPINYLVPEGVSAEVTDQTQITLKSIDKQLLGQAAAEIRDFSPPEPYKGKGVRYFGEKIKRKESKKA